MATRLGY